MIEFQDRGEPVYVARDSGYSKLKYLSSENRQKSIERMKNDDRKSSKEFLKEIFGEFGIVVNPEKMSYWHRHIK